MQGGTVDHAVIYLGSRLFAAGQAYVVLSRQLARFPTQYSKHIKIKPRNYFINQTNWTRTSDTISSGISTNCGKCYRRGVLAELPENKDESDSLIELYK
ncbi:unnamed protein product [Acanthoscelides obtectus]|uniref:Uncharacterized protein n=1 Tax=Acanthoscelides obtectus TaxID=200917 RepID=A0A9P0LLS6_ACAOB|nr:unnamed protein product [Acanthoscelides obtectus]CAK1640339.1 hypothetical protein AOBTE_LOCUS11663 [Acanthoscelides obtectus]